MTTMNEEALATLGRIVLILQKAKAEAATLPLGPSHRVLKKAIDEALGGN